MKNDTSDATASDSKRDSQAPIQRSVIADLIATLRIGGVEHEICGQTVVVDLPAAKLEAARRWYHELKTYTKATKGDRLDYRPA